MSVASTTTLTPTRIAVVGASGRTGRRVVACASNDAAFEVVAGLTRADADMLERAAAPAPDVDVVVDFSTPDGTRTAIALARRLHAAIVIGTTGLPDEIHQAAGDLAESQAVLVAGNTSLGMAILRRLATDAARALGPGFDIDLVESHRAGKRDAPSGSALQLADAINDVTGGALPSERVHSMRSGDIVGDHEVRFSGPGEMIFLSHRASNRDLFARGALTAAAWLRGRSAGRYTMDDVLADS